MIRGITVAALFLAVAVSPALAQTSRHGPGHVRPDSGKHHPHGPDHVRPDSATHAAMHARLHGSWAGTLRSHAGAEKPFAMAVTRDSVRQVAVSFTAEQAPRFGAAEDFALSGDKLTWTQDLAGAPCKAIAVVSAATSKAPAELKGTMTCDRDELTFSVRKKAD